MNDHYREGEQDAEDETQSAERRLARLMSHGIINANTES
jgi:hypothetical protein